MNHSPDDWRKKIITAYGIKKCYQKDNVKIRKAEQDNRNAWIRAAHKKTAEKLRPMTDAMLKIAKNKAKKRVSNH